MTVKELIDFLQAQPDTNIEIFVQNGNRVHPIAGASKAFIFSQAKVVNTNSNPCFYDDWHIANKKTLPQGLKTKDVLVLVDALDASHFIEA